MNSLTRTRFIAAAALALAGFGAASAAHARTDVFFSVALPGPAYVQPAPVYVQPRPVYTQPQVVYTQPRVVYTQEPVYEQYQTGYQPVYGYGWEAERARRLEAWRQAEWRRHHQHGWNDRDHDHDREHDRDHDRDGRGHR
jgi:hypothetical protein